MNSSFSASEVIERGGTESSYHILLSVLQVDLLKTEALSGVLAVHYRGIFAGAPA